MVTRNCAGGVVFKGDKIFLLETEQGEWTLPKGYVSSGMSSPQKAVVEEVKKEAGIAATVVMPVGESYFELFSVSKDHPVCNKTMWFIMETLDQEDCVHLQEGFKSFGYFTIDEALEKITKNHDKSLANVAYKHYKELSLA